MAGMDLGLDLGSSRIVIASSKGVLWDEPAVMAVETATDRPIAYGTEAETMWGRAPKSIAVIRPIQGGIIADYAHAEQLLKYCLRQVCRYKIIKPRVAVCVPSEMTEVEKRSILEALDMAGARQVSIIHKAVAAAVGAGVDIRAAHGCMSIHIGAGTTEIATIALGGVAASAACRIGGQHLDAAIVHYVRDRYSLIIGEKTAEQAKIACGGVLPRADVPTVSVRGRDALTGLPRTQILTAPELCDAIREPLNNMFDIIHAGIEHTPPELLADVLGDEVILSGGSVQLHGFAEWLHTHVRTPCRIADTPTHTAAIGAAASVDILAKAGGNGMNVRTFSYHLSDNVV